MKSNHSNFFDEHPVLYPFPEILRQRGFAITYKPREVKFKSYIEKLVIRSGDKVLDVGCGDGVILDRIVKSYRVKGYGIDPSSDSIKRAKLLSGKSVRFSVARAEKLPFKNEFFDSVVSFDSLEHIGNGKNAEVDKKKAILEMVRVLKPGGRLLVYSININQKYTWNWIVNKLGIDIYKKWDHSPELFVDPNWLTKKLKLSGLNVKKVELYNSFFTLIFDELIMLLSSMLIKFCFYKKNRIKRNFADKFLIVLTVISRGVNMIFEPIDKIWVHFGYSNSFFVLAKK